jgi:class 3 adenylate cyclase
MGITSGWVTVGNIGSAACADDTFLGNEVDLASRLANRAEPGEILVSDRTMAKVVDPGIGRGGRRGDVQRGVAPDQDLLAVAARSARRSRGCACLTDDR